VIFWSNHFTVSTRRPLIYGLAGAFEREAIRPHVNGRFADMLLAVVRHPAMLVYLDNIRSIGPDSAAGRRGGRGRNENLAREVLELHTLGVDGGYNQDDVIALANILTGWMAGSARGGPPGRFQFMAPAHQPGTQTLLGRRYADEGAAQGERALDDLARHPATARHIARKLARHFISDDPPDSAIAQLAERFEDSDGNLAALGAEIVSLEPAWQPRPGKIKTPWELMVAAGRALWPVQPDSEWTLKTLHTMGQMPFSAPSPAGWDDIAAPWIGGDALMRRLDWAERAAARLGQVPDPERLADTVLDGAGDDATRLAVSRAPSARTAVALLLASPGFQRR